MEKMKIHPAELAPEATPIEGSLPPAILDLSEPQIRAEAPVEVRLQAFIHERKLIVSGSLQTKFKLECGRCAEFIEWPVTVDNFYQEWEEPMPKAIDLTPLIREDILLSLPLTAVCQLSVDYKCPFSGKRYPPAAEPPSLASEEAWQALDKLKIKTDQKTKINKPKKKK
jgi:uncharacterized protein